MNANIIIKSELTSQQLTIINSEMSRQAKSKTTAYLFLIFLGGFGAHRFYIGDKGKGFLLLFTVGGLLIGALIDLFFIGKRVDEINEQIELGIINNIKGIRH